MKSRWTRGPGDDQHPPVEMRFVDMFMTALGSLIFLALLLFLLLSELREQTPPPAPRPPAPSAPTSPNARVEDRDIIKRWFSVVLVTQGCGNNPELYVRWEGKLSNFLTGELVADAVEFDARNPMQKQVSVGYAYIDIGNGAMEETDNTESSRFPVSGLGLDVLKRSGLDTKTFTGVARAPGSFSVYVGLKDPRAQGEKECAIYPFYLSSLGVIPGEMITMLQSRPFAWLRRFSISADGSTTLGTAPRADETFKRDIAEFSRKQSQMLCDWKPFPLCDTVDAHYAVLTPATPVAAAPLTPVQARALKPSESFKECATCPEMVVVPKGDFMMGAPANEAAKAEDEAPQHLVTIAYPFAAGRFAVTFNEWDACVFEKACPPANDNGWGRGQRPVINVTWDDAQTYVAWLSRKTGRPYRLLSEAEREYVARAGTTSAYWWGATISPNQANYENNQGGRTVAVDRFAPNPWGLYQVHGNIFEWVQDCWHGNYVAAPSNGSPWTTGDCRLRVRRGGSWLSGPRSIRSAYRAADGSDRRGYGTGFRVARTLDPKQGSTSVGVVQKGTAIYEGGRIKAFANFSMSPLSSMSELDTIPPGFILKARSKLYLWDDARINVLRDIDANECFEVVAGANALDEWLSVKNAVCPY